VVASEAAASYLAAGWQADKAIVAAIAADPIKNLRIFTLLHCYKT
jgi:hypothetical protein